MVGPAECHVVTPVLYPHYGPSSFTTLWHRFSFHVVISGSRHTAGKVNFLSSLRCLLRCIPSSVQECGTDLRQLTFPPIRLSDLSLYLQ